MKKKRKGRPVGSTNKTRPVNGHTHTHTHIHGKGKGKGKAAAAALPTHRQPADIVCSFCEGGDQRNKLGVPEKMVSCALCGRSGHPSCLQMTSRLAKTVMTYGWTCLDCKACEICEMRDVSSRLLFLSPFHSPLTNSSLSQLVVNDGAT